MTLDNLYQLAKTLDTQFNDNKITAEIVVFMNEAKHELLQQEVYKYANHNTLIGYKSQTVFDIVLYNNKFTFKIKK